MNPEISFGGLLLVVAIGLATPITLAVSSLRRLPAIVLIVAGSVLGRSGCLRTVVIESRAS